MSAILVEFILEAQTCCTCGIPFGMPDYHKKRLLQEGGTFYCPNGHGQRYNDPEIPSLKKQLKEAESRAALIDGYYRAEQDDHEYTRRHLSATKGVLTKTKKRVANGACPCCSRHFTNLQRHMTTKHPDYSTENQEEL